MPPTGPAPAWFPQDSDSSNIAWLMRRVGQGGLSRPACVVRVAQRQQFWEIMVQRLGVQFREPCSCVLDPSRGAEHPQWLVGAKLNVVESCFQASGDSPAVLYQADDGSIERLSIADLRSLAFRVANGLVAMGMKPGDRVAIDMPMTVESVAIYLGCCGGGLPCGSPWPTASRRRRLPSAWGSARPAAFFTQDFAIRLGKRLPLYESVRAAGAPRAIVVPDWPAR